MIDLKNKPEGATHYSVRSGKVYCWYMILDNGYMYLYDGEVGKIDWCEGIHSQPVHELSNLNGWTIYSNTLPLSKLSDEQAAELFNYWRSDGSIEIFDGSHWHSWSHIASASDVFRAKQKTERELFVEAGMSGCSFDNAHADTVRSVLGQMFGAGFKAPKDSER